MRRVNKTLNIEVQSSPHAVKKMFSRSVRVQPGLAAKWLFICEIHSPGQPGSHSPAKSLIACIQCRVAKKLGELDSEENVLPNWPQNMNQISFLYLFSFIFSVLDFLLLSFFQLSPCVGKDNMKACFDGCQTKPWRVSQLYYTFAHHLTHHWCPSFTGVLDRTYELAWPALWGLFDNVLVVQDCRVGLCEKRPGAAPCWVRDSSNQF